MQVFRLRDSTPLWHCLGDPTFSFDGKLAYVPNAKGLSVLDGHTGRKLRGLPGPTMRGFAPSTDGKWLYEARDGKIFRWRAR